MILETARLILRYQQRSDVAALIEPENAASERVARKVGMRFDREVVRPGGALRKVYVVEATDQRGTPNARRGQE